jgi:hypothetical protein
MKQTQKLINCLVACAVALAMVSTVAAQTVKERTAKVVRVKGAARYSTGNNVWQPLEPGTRLKAGAIINTAGDSYVDIVLDESGSSAPFATETGQISTGAVLSYRPTAERDVLRVFADSVLAIDKLTKMDTGADQVTETQLDLRSGKIFGSVKKLSAASRYEVKIPNGVAGIRGTMFVITADGIVSVYSGSVVIAYTSTGPDGQPVTVTQVVMAGYQFNARTGEMTPFTEPAPQPPPTAMTAPATFVVDHTAYFVSPTQE